MKEERNRGVLGPEVLELEGKKMDLYVGFCGRSKESACNAGNWGLIPGSKLPWRRKWQPTLVFFPGKFQGQKSLWATVHGVTKSWTQLSDFHFHFCVCVISWED